MTDTRLDINMTNYDIMVAMSDGNPGAVSVITEIMVNGGKIDTDDALGGLGSIMTMDSLGIYGGRIWCLHKYVCGQDLMKTIAMLRAYQLGELAGVTKEALLHSIENLGRGLDVAAAVSAVKEALPDFNMEYAA